ncbi:MAG TPA: ATP-binding protein [Verrucomicrobiae bacterium]|nr:ATP-binding protein [Verrucomicrobiae bacterium]
MRWLLYLRLVLLTAGTLLPFFWMVVILGHRRQRNFERVFFFLCLALTCFFGSSLLATNAELYYGTPPRGLLRFAWTFLCLGLWFIPSFTLHLHAEYALIRGLLPSRQRVALWLAASYLPAAILAPNLFAALFLHSGFDFERPTHILGIAFQLWLVAAVAVAAYWQRRFLQLAPDRAQKAFHKSASEFLSVLAVALLVMVFLERIRGSGTGTNLSPLLFLLALVPLGLLIGNVQRFNFLQIGRQRNLIYAVFMVFVALLYLSFVRRASLWWEHYLPPEATAALLLFLPVVFFEPLQRLMGSLLRKTAQTEVDRAQKLMGPINEVARLGNQSKLREFSERWIAEQLQLAEAHLSLDAGGAAPHLLEHSQKGSEEVFKVGWEGRHLGSLRVRAHGAMISGETYAALEFLSEQLPAAFDLCGLIEEKLQLERELAERQRLALVGQMAASISHNLKNPLGSIKTILQVQMEGTELPASLRQETQMVLDEINRLSGKLNQLLQFSRPGVRAGSGSERCSLAQASESVVSVLRHEAENRGVVLELRPAEPEMWAAASAEVANDILSNLVLNAIEATPSGGHVRITMQAAGGDCQVTVEDDGPGIPPELREKVLQPFFTTKPRGTGLGLAIVQRRLEELGGTIEWWSPKEDGLGTRFRIALPASGGTAQRKNDGATADVAREPRK